MEAAHRIIFLESGWLTATMCVLGLVAGLAVGGALYTIAWRMTHRRLVLTARCRCPQCSHPLVLREMIPVVGWLMRHGRCAYCDAPISVAYPASELLGAGIVASVVLRYGLALQTVEVLVLASVLLVVSLTSLWDYTIPNEWLLAAVIARACYLLALQLSGTPVRELAMASLVGAIALALPLLVALFVSNAMLVRDMTGTGTVKLVAVIGLYLGWQQGIVTVLVALLIALVVWLVSPSKLMPVEVDGGAQEEGAHDGLDGVPAPLPDRPTGEEDLAEPLRLIPLAPSLALACWIMLLVGAPVSPWSAPLF